MTKICCVIGCKSASYPGCGISMFRFPSDDVIRQKWDQIVPLKRKMKNYYICNLHFKPEDIIHFSKLLKLKPEAVPSIFPKKSDAKLIQSQTDSSSEEPDTKNERFGLKSGDESIHCFSKKDGTITHIFENKLRGSILHSLEKIDEDANCAPDINEEVISDTDSIFDPPSVVNLKHQLQKEKKNNELCRDEIAKLQCQNKVLRKRNSKCKHLIKRIKEKYIRTSRYPDGRIEVEFSHKIN